MKRTIFIVTLLGFLIGCRHSQEGQKEETAQDTVEVEEKESIRPQYPGEYEIDKPDDILAYFDSLHKHGIAIICTHGNDQDDSLMVWQAVRELDRFVHQQRAYYPAELLREALKKMAFEQGYLYSHGGDEQKGAIRGEVFLFRLLEQAALNCPQIDFITDFHTADNRAGILYYPEWSGMHSLYSFLIYQSEHGYRVLLIDGKGFAKITKIFHLTDAEGRTYYLCSHNEHAIEFCQYLYGWNGVRMKLLCSTRKRPSSELVEDKTAIIFNPSKCQWDYCVKEGNTYQKIENSTSLRLILDGENSKFVIE